MQVSQQPFSPLAGGTVNIVASTSSQRVQIQTDNDDSSCIRIYNAGATPTDVFVEFGGSTVVASLTTSMPVPKGMAILVACPEQYVAVIASAAGSTVYFTPGNGVS